MSHFNNPLSTGYSYIMFYVSTPAVFNQSSAAAVLIFLKDFASMKFQHYIFIHFEINIILIRIPNVFYFYLYFTPHLNLA